MLTSLGYELPRVLTPPLAQRIGVSRSQVRTQVGHGNWRCLAAGAVLTRPDAPTRDDWVEAGVVLAGPSAALSGWDALRLHGLRAGAPPPSILVLSRTGRSRRIGPVLIRRTDRPFLAIMTSVEQPVLPLTPIALVVRAVTDLAVLTRDPTSIRALVAQAVQRGRTTPEEIAEELRHCPRNGSGHLRRALGEVAAGARSAAEAAAVRQLAGSHLPDFEMNVPVLDLAGRLLYVLDVFWRHLRAVLEIDGREFHFASADWHATMRRHNVLTAGRLAVVHYPPSVIARRDGGWLAEVEQWLRARAAELDQPWLATRSARPVWPAAEPEPLLLGIVTDPHER